MRRAAVRVPMSPRALQRRRLTGAMLAALPSALLGIRALVAAGLRPTPAQTEGPFYPAAIPEDSDFDLLRNGTLAYPEGRPVWLEGRVTDTAGKPLAGVQVEIWQTDHAGRYHHPGDGGRADKRFQGFGRVTTGEDGRYRFHTIRPVAYEGRTPHIHLKVKRDGRELLTTQIYVAGEPANLADSLWSGMDTADRVALTVGFEPGSDGLHAWFPIVIVP